MNQDWGVVMPHIGPRQNLIENLQSLGEVTVPFLIVDNSPTSDTKSMELPKGIEVIYHPENAGVAKSFNLGLKRGAKYTVVMSVSMRFGKGLSDFIQQSEEHVNEWGLNYHIGMHVYTFGKSTVDRIGFFDENLSPAYYEDCDYWRRMIVAGINSKVPVYKPTDVWCIGDAISLKEGFVKFDVASNQKYYIAKWGKLPPDDYYMFPFNNPELPLSYWVPGGKSAIVNSF